MAILLRGSNAVFSPDGKYLYVGNYMDDDISILKVDGTVVTDTGKRFALPGGIRLRCGVSCPEESRRYFVALRNGSTAGTSRGDEKIS